MYIKCDAETSFLGIYFRRYSHKYANIQVHDVFDKKKSNNLSSRQLKKTLRYIHIVEHYVAKKNKLAPYVLTDIKVGVCTSEGERKIKIRKLWRIFGGIHYY